MAAKEVRFSDDARAKMLAGVNVLANAVIPITVLLIIAEVKDKFPLKDAVPMLVTVLGIVTVVIPKFKND